MSHDVKNISVNQTAHSNEPCHSREWVMSHIWMSHVPRMETICKSTGDERVMSRIHVIHESRPTYEWVISHIETPFAFDLKIKWEAMCFRCNTLNTLLQRTATHCNTLQTHCKHTANTLQHTATHCKHTANTLQTHGNTLQHTVTHCNHLQIKREAICFQFADPLL